MQHKGEIIEQAVRESGFSITRLAKRMGKSRRWVYQIFKSRTVPVDYIIAIGKVIHHDFSEDIEDLKHYKVSIAKQITNDPQRGFGTDKDEVEYWKNKYLSVLEKYNDLLISLK
ncbi:MAG: helix-turn-helix transcriptional regulator [Crocinitomicaceae bacterium]|nr:helix-turn-helix transcriptional regulator [Crocinitomicaceae bacterium]